MTVYSWVSTNVVDGRVVADFPDLVVGSILQTVGRYESVQAALPLPTAPPEWLRATLPGASNLVLLSQQTDSFGSLIGTPVPIWGAMITQRTLDESDTIQLTLATMEAYLDRIYMGNWSFTGAGQNDIVATIILNFVRSGNFPIRLQYSGSGTARDRTYADIDDKTVYSVLTDLMGVQGGPEWYIGWESLTPGSYTPVMFVGGRVGSPVTPGFAPQATFEMPGPVKSFQLVLDYSNGKGANSVTATSTGTGTTRPQSPPQTVSDPLRPTFQYRFTPSTSITDVNTLVSWAQSSLAQQKDGTTALALTASADDAPQLGTDWVLGDDVGFNIGGLDSAGNDLVPAFPGGFSGVARVIAWQLDMSDTPIITPVFVGSNI